MSRSPRARILGPRLVAIGLAVGSAFAFGSTLTVEQGCADKAPPASAPPPIIIGVSLGLTNGLAAFAGPLRDAIRVAEGQINAAGGLLGRPVTFDVRDDLSDESSGVAAVAQKFVDEGAVAVIGPIGSQQVVATQGIFAGAHILQISPSATSTDLTNIQPATDRWLFRTTPADDFQGAAIMLLAQKTPKGLADGGAPTVDGGAPATCNKLAIVNIDNSYGNSMADVIEKYFPKKSGKSIALRKKIAVELADNYKAEAAAVLATTPDCMALISYDDVAAQFVRDIKADTNYAAAAGKGFFMMGTDGVYTDGFLKYGLENQADPTSNNVAEGVFGTNPDTQPGTPEYNQFKTIFNSYFPIPAGKEAPAFTANTYDAAILLALAIQKACSADPNNAVGKLHCDPGAIRDALIQVATPPGKSFSPASVAEALQALQQGADIDYKGASGNVDLEANGNVKSGFIVWEAYRIPQKNVDYRTIGRFSLDELLDQLK